jgi:recombinational DNA repair protein RecR
MDFKSKLLNDAVEQMSSLPGVGKRSALRLVLYLLDQSEKEVKDFTQAFLSLKEILISVVNVTILLNKKCVRYVEIHLDQKS